MVGSAHVPGLSLGLNSQLACLCPACRCRRPTTATPTALVQELLHNKTQSSAGRTRMLVMIRSSATCLLNNISSTLSTSSSDVPASGGGGAGGGTGGPASGAPRRQHKVGVVVGGCSICEVLRGRSAPRTVAAASA